MDGATFDRLTKKLGQRHSRRSVAAGIGLLGATGAAAGTAQIEADQRFPESCRNFAISGSRDPREDFNYDDDMRIVLIPRRGRREVLLNDRDGEIGQGNEDVDPIVFRAEIGDELKITVRDRQPDCYSMEALFLHCCRESTCQTSRASRRIAKRIRRTCPRNWRPQVFFNETIVISRFG